MKEAASRKKGGYKAMCKNSFEENKKMHKRMKSKSKKTVSKALREKTKEALTE